MSQIESLLSDYKSGGLEDSAGVFTIDFQAAREKLSKFQLADPHEFLLKFVQAGNLAAKDIEVELSSKSSILLRGWSPDLTLEKLAERLASAGLIVGDDPLTHICVGLSALMGFVPQGVRLCQRVKGAKSAKLLDLGTTLEWKEIESNHTDGSSLKIWWPGVAEISKKTLANLLRERCTYSAVPIALDGEGFEAAIPETSGAHREKFFTTNETLAEHRLLRAQSFSSPMVPARPDAKITGDSSREAHLRLTVDLDSTATIWMVKAGVMSQKKRMDLGVPGIVGVVFADDVATDLTGSQFLENETFEEVRGFLKNVSSGLKEEALVHARNIAADSQPASPKAPLKTLLSYSICLFAFFGLLVSLWLMSPSVFMAFGLVIIFFWLFLPVPAIWWISRRYGCAKDQHTDEAAKRYLLSVLS